jgi:metallo-beta-lactamase class B
MKKLSFSLLFILLALLAASIDAQQSETDRRWNAPVEPFKIIGSVYYVGAAEITSFLITTPDGHILLDGGYAETAPQIVANIKKLGFRPEDVKYLLNSQAHFDHAGGFAELVRLTGAPLLASRADAVLLANGGRGDFHFGDTLPYEPVRVARFVKDGTRVRLGGVTMRARLTPGHTKGCTSWTLETAENGRRYLIVFVGSTTIPGYDLVGNDRYPQIAADYERTFRVLKKLKPDVFLASHGAFFGLTEKTEALRRGKSPNPFIDPQGYREFLAGTEAQFRERLKAQEGKKLRVKS